MTCGRCEGTGRKPPGEGVERIIQGQCPYCKGTGSSSSISFLAPHTPVYPELPRGGMDRSWITPWYSVFLAGSIDMGQAHDWQADVTQSISDYPIAIFNPRREAWDPSWEQDISNPPFREQVEWELDRLDQCNLIIMWLGPDGPAPIALLELGLYAGDSSGGRSRILVGCHPDYWRRGNVQVVCVRKRIPLFDSLDELVAATRTRLDREFFRNYNRRK